jgi:hypothetical protein
VAVVAVVAVVAIVAVAAAEGGSEHFAMQICHPAGSLDEQRELYSGTSWSQMSGPVGAVVAPTTLGHWKVVVVRIRPVVALYWSADMH